MKISGKGPNTPVDFTQAKVERSKTENSNSPAASSDRVSAKLSQVLSSITDAIAESGLTAGQLHSNVDEARLNSILDSLDRIEAKRPEVDMAKLLQMTDRVSSQMLSRPEDAVAAFKKPDPSRVSELI
jgi:hypothetical protein